jgi:hypothetical protein
MEISRRDFVRDALGAVAFAGIRSDLVGQTPGPAAHNIEDPYYHTLVKANDASVPPALERVQGTKPLGPRVLGGAVDILAGAYCAPESSYFQSPTLLPALEQAADKLLAAQHADGTIDSGNYHSPPDTGFVVQELCTALTVLRRANRRELSSVNSKLEKFLLAAGDALTTGGIHTPNHRWVISSALAQLNALFPSPKYIARVDDWLGEGIYCDADGQFSERSTAIYSRVIDNALITMARLLPRPELLEPVRRNLAMNLFYMHPDGELETVASRRQDQLSSGSIANYYLQYRYMAIHDGNRQFAAATRFIEQMGLDRAEVKLPLAEFLEEPLYRRALPETEPLPATYARVFSNSGLARVRRGEVSATIYGGSDWPLGVASGLASNPTFFNFRKGKAVLESVRMVADFFDEGPFRSAGLKVQQNEYLLHQQLSVPYYQPLPRQFRNPQGDYPLTPADHRFWSKLNFPERPRSNIQILDQRVHVSENAGSFDLAFDVQGHDRVQILIELTFRKGGALHGTEPSPAEPNVHFLREGMGRYIVGQDAITFGPGEAGLETLPPLETYHDPYLGPPKPDTYRVYITGFTPFQRTITVA